MVIKNPTRMMNSARRGRNIPLTGAALRSQARVSAAVSVNPQSHRIAFVIAILYAKQLAAESSTVTPGL